MTTKNEIDNSSIYAVSFFTLLILSYFQICLAVFLNDMLDGYRGIMIPGGDVSEPWFVMFHAGALFISSLASVVIYVKTKNRVSGRYRSIFVTLPYLLPLWSAQDWIMDAAREHVLSDNYYSIASQHSAWISIVLVALFLIFQATIPHWVSLLFNKTQSQD